MDLFLFNSDLETMDASKLKEVISTLKGKAKTGQITPADARRMIRAMAELDVIKRAVKRANRGY